MPKGLAQLHAREFLETVEHLRVERLARHRAPFERGQVVGSHIFLNHIAIDRGRRAERSDAVFCQHGEQIVRVEAVEIVHKERRPAQPLAIELAPAALRPAAIRRGEVDGVFIQIVPEAPGDDVSQRIGEAVRHHLGHARGARGEVHQHDVVVRVGPRGQSGRGARFLHHAGKIQETFARSAQAGRGHAAFLRGGKRVLAHLVLAHADHQLCLGSGDAVGNILLLQLRGGRNLDAAQLHQAQRDRPVFPAALEQQDHHIALLQPQRLERVCGLVRKAAKIAKGEDALLLRLVRPDHGALVGGQARVFIHHIVSEIEVLRHRIIIIGEEILQRIIIQAGKPI